MRFAKPHSGSLLAYLMAASAIIAAEPSSPGFISLADIDQSDFSQRDRDWLDRHETSYQWFREAYSKQFIQELKDAGFPEAKLAAPHTPQLAAFLDLQWQRTQLCYVALSQLSAAAPCDEFDPAARAIAGLLMNLPKMKSQNARFVEASRLLNEDAPRDHWLSVHHVRRAFKRNISDHARFLLRRGGGPLPVPEHKLSTIIFQETQEEFEALLRLWRAAKKHPDLKDFTGSALAYRIDEKFDLPKRFAVQRDEIDAEDRRAVSLRKAPLESHAD
jgi:hypothetical protein